VTHSHTVLAVHVLILPVLYTEKSCLCYSIFTDGHPPPAAKQVVKDLPTVKTSAVQEGKVVFCHILDLF